MGTFVFMHLEQFIQQILASPSGIFKYPVIAFYGAQYPLLLMSQLIKHVSVKNPGMVIPLNLQNYETVAVNSQFQTTFLGRTSLYWLADTLGQSSRASQQEWLNYLSMYQGPNTVMFFMAGQPPKSIPTEWSVITIPDQLSRELVAAIIKIYQTDTTFKIDQQFIRYIQSMAHQLTLDQLCLLLHYATITVGGAPEFFNEWVPHLITPEQSLFTLSQHLFARKVPLFIAQWIQVRDHYAAPFWVSFWSEQVWRAAYFIEYSKAGDRVEAKKISYKLPFSFIQRDWTQHTVAELKAAHQLLYDLDSKLKNGGDELFLDYFYLQFFSRQTNKSISGY